mgnify:CR=1 FL=1
MTASDDRGRDAEVPTDIPGRGWIDVLARVRAESKRDNVGILAAGVAFFAMLAIVPAAAAVVAVGGDLDPAHRETAKQPSPAAHRSVEKTVSAPDWHDGPATQ